ncbi:MAG: type III pantothenate kinase, partial [Anaerolineae bacterium]
MSAHARCPRTECDYTRCTIHTFASTKGEMMLLAVDIGNTNVVLGAHDGKSWRHHWRVRTVR